ncbi:MAG: hypothetical protein ACOY0T_40445 [Myxococcota bacterium]
MTDPIFRQAKTALQALSADTKARIMADRREAELLFRNYEVNLVRREGELKGRADMLVEQLTERFGELPAGVRERVQGANVDELRAWTSRVLTAASLDAVFAG